MKNKKFDCIKLQHDGAEKIYKRIQKMTIEEEMSYWRERSKELQHSRQARQRSAEKKKIKSA